MSAIRDGLRKYGHVVVETNNEYSSDDKSSSQEIMEISKRDVWLNDEIYEIYPYTRNGRSLVPTRVICLKNWRANVYGEDPALYIQCCDEALQRQVLDGEAARKNDVSKQQKDAETKEKEKRAKVFSDSL